MRTAYINGFPAKNFYQEKSWARKLHGLAENTGNWVYINEMRKQIDFKKESGIYDKEYLLDEFDAGIMPVSNMLRPEYDGILDWIDLIEKIKFPITFAGLGTQSYYPDLYTPKKIVAAIKPEVKKAFQRVAYQTTSLGIRGEETAEVLDLMGIHNYRIIGCPSFYQYLDGNYIKKPYPTKDKVIFNIQPARKTSGLVIEMGMENDAHWIMQTESEGMKYLYTNELVSEEYINKKLMFDRSTNEVQNYIKRRAHVFFEQKEWEDFLGDNGFTFSFGMRFHGNMLSHLKGIPSLWIGHDVRTKELIKALKLPNVTLEEYRDIHDIDELIERCDYSQVEKNYRRMCEEYVKFLDENNISHKFHFSE